MVEHLKLITEDYAPDNEIPKEDEMPIQTGGGDGSLSERIGERLAALEEAIRGVRHSQALIATFTTVILVVLVTIGIAVSSFTLNRVDRLGDKIDRLPSELHTIANTLAGVISAAKQQPPIIVTVPAAPKQSEVDTPPRSGGQ